MSEAGAAKATTGKHGGGNVQAPPPDKPKDWKPLGTLFYKANDDVFEFRVVCSATLPLLDKLREELHNKHGIVSGTYGG